MTTSRVRVFSCGFFNGPKDIPHTVTEGSEAAAARFLAKARGSLARQKVFPPEREKSGEPPRVGVFVCHCGLNIGAVVDITAVVEHAAGLPGVVYAQAQMVTIIKEHNLNRVVVAACTPATHQATFQDMLRRAGLNKYLFEMVNIRNQCTFEHRGEPAATQKCKDLVHMAVAKARLLEPLEYILVPVNKKALVIGGVCRA